jgi:hypothetical protein
MEPNSKDGIQRFGRVVQGDNGVGSSLFRVANTFEELISKKVI